MQYYIHMNGQQQGPFEESELPNRGINSETPVWCQTMTDWAPAGQVPALAYMFQQQPPQTDYQQPPQTGYQPQQYDSVKEPKPDNHMTMAIFATVLGFFCCGLIGGGFGVYAIVQANKVNNLYAMEQYDEAESAAESAKNMSTVAFVLAAIGLVASFLVAVNQ